MAIFPDPFTLLHNPRCSKSRAAKALLDERGVDYRTRLYLEEPLSSAELAELQRRLGIAPREWLRRGEEEFRQANLGSELGDGELLTLMARAPIVIERPILIARERAVVGRPPEKILDLL
ncbi:MAG TPA: arsenate reductase (glutaredoxin) [Terriglobales bacterium]|nr:arsenate reductase (glutaredoxin) [Terriglobales bacterium]